MNNIFTFIRKNIFIILNCIMLIMSIIYIFILLNYYKNLKSLKELNYEMVNHVDDLSNKTETLYNEISLLYDEESALYNDLESDSNYIKNTSLNINSTYVDKNEIDNVNSIIDYIIDSSNYNNEYDPDELSDLVDELNDTINDNNSTINNLMATKEDKSNRTSSITSNSETTYPSAKTIDEALSSADQGDLSLFNIMFPIGSIYVSLNNETPLIGEWEKLDLNATLWNTSTQYGQFLGPTLPNVRGTAGSSSPANGNIGPAFTSYQVGTSKAGSTLGRFTVTMDFSLCSSIYKKNTPEHPEYSTTVRPAAIAVTIFRRVS